MNVHSALRRIAGLAGVTLAALLCATALPVAAQAPGDYPSKTVTMVMPYPPGGLADAASRRLAQRLSEMWKVSVVVDSKPGAAGLLGAGIVANGPADGYTLLYTIPETLSITKASRQTTQGFDVINDLQPIALVAVSSTTLAVPAESAHKTFKDFIDYARKNPGKLNFGVQGTGSTFHLALEQLKAMAGVDITAVPYKGAAPTMTDLLAGRLDGIIVSTSVSMPYVHSGKLRVLAMASKDRVAQVPGVAPIAESFPGYDSPVTLGVLVRAGTPRPIVDRLSRDIRQAMNEPAMVEWLATLATVTSNITPDEFRARMQREVANYQTLMDKAGIKLE